MKTNLYDPCDPIKNRAGTQLGHSRLITCKVVLAYELNNSVKDVEIKRRREREGSLETLD